MISVVMVQHNSYELSLQAIGSLKQHHTGHYEIVLVDNGSTEQGARRLGNELEGVNVIRIDRNLGFGAANNVGAKAAKGDLFFFLNNDTIIEDNILDGLEKYYAQHSRCGAAGIGLMNTDRSPQYSVGRFPSVLSEWKMSRRLPLYRPSEYQAVDWVTGAALSVRRNVFEMIGGFDERYFMYFEDIDLCKRIHNAGFEVHYVSVLRAVHHGGGSQPHGLTLTMQQEYRRSQVWYYSLHASVLQSVLLRLYLFGKYAGVLMTGEKERRRLAKKVIEILLKPTHAHRN